MKHPSAPLYPELPAEPANEPPAVVAAGTAEDSGTRQYRLQQITLLKRQLEEEWEIRKALNKKYRRCINAVDNVDTVLLTASMGVGVGGVCLLSTIIAAPVVLGLEIGALVCGLLGMGGKFISRRLAVKAKKRNQVRVLAENKLNTIADHVSTAMTDGKISEEEFRLILDEVSKYQKMKDEIRNKAQKAHAAVVIDEDTKNSLSNVAGPGTALLKSWLLIP
jgi:membrane-associated HD superfamily phosphohydrolase